MCTKQGQAEFAQENYICLFAKTSLKQIFCTTPWGNKYCWDVFIKPNHPHIRQL